MSREFFLAYDADCGPCAVFKRALEFLDGYHRFAFVSLTDADARGFLNGVPPSLRLRSFHLVAPDGTLLSGADALPTVVSLFPSGGVVSKAILLAPGGFRTVGFFYRVLSRLHNSGSCKHALEQGSRLDGLPLRS